MLNCCTTTIFSDILSVLFDAYQIRNVDNWVPILKNMIGFAKHDHAIDMYRVLHENAFACLFSPHTEVAISFLNLLQEAVDNKIISREQLAELLIIFNEKKLSPVTHSVINGNLEVANSLLQIINDNKINNTCFKPEHLKSARTHFADAPFQHKNAEQCFSNLMTAIAPTISKSKNMKKLGKFNETQFKIAVRAGVNLYESQLTIPREERAHTPELFSQRRKKRNRIEPEALPERREAWKKK